MHAVCEKGGSCLLLYGMLVCLPVCVLHCFPQYERYLRCLPPHSLAFHCCELLFRMCTRQHECMLLMSGATCVCPFLPCLCIPLWVLLDDIPLYTLLCECSVPASPSFTFASSYCECALTNMNVYLWRRGELLPALFRNASICLPVCI